MKRTLFPFSFSAIDRSSGFTLAELIAVLVIAGILAVSATTYFSKSTFDAAAFADLGKSVVSQAQKVAIAQRRTVFVVTTANSISVCYDAGCTSPVASFAGSPSTMIYNAPAGVNIAPATSFSFDGLGKPSTSVSFTISGSSGFTVAAETGYVY